MSTSKVQQLEKAGSLQASTPTMETLLRSKMSATTPRTLVRCTTGAQVAVSPASLAIALVKTFALVNCWQTEEEHVA